MLSWQDSYWTYYYHSSFKYIGRKKWKEMQSEIWNLVCSLSVHVTSLLLALLALVYWPQVKHWILQITTNDYFLVRLCQQKLKYLNIEAVSYVDKFSCEWHIGIFKGVRENDSTWNKFLKGYLRCFDNTKPLFSENWPLWKPPGCFQTKVCPGKICW